MTIRELWGRGDEHCATFRNKHISNDTFFSGPNIEELFFVTSSNCWTVDVESLPLIDCLSSLLPSLSFALGH